MTLVKFNNRTRNSAPYFNNVFDSLFSDAFNKNQYVQKSPAVNIHESESQYEIELAAPGLEKGDFQINLKKDTLSVWVEKKSQEGTIEKDYSRKEFDFSSFARSFIMPEGIDADQINAVYTNGVLYISIAKKDEAKALHREITVL